MHQIFGDYLGDEVEVDWEVGGWLELKVTVDLERERGKVLTEARRSVKNLRNRKVIISPDTLITKYKSLTFSYFTYTFFNSISIEIY